MFIVRITTNQKREYAELGAKFSVVPIQNATAEQQSSFNGALSVIDSADAIVPVYAGILYEVISANGNITERIYNEVRQEDNTTAIVTPENVETLEATPDNVETLEATPDDVKPEIINESEN